MDRVNRQLPMIFTPVKPMHVATARQSGRLSRWWPDSAGKPHQTEAPGHAAGPEVVHRCRTKGSPRDEPLRVYTHRIHSFPGRWPRSPLSQPWTCK